MQLRIQSMMPSTNIVLNSNNCYSNNCYSLALLRQEAPLKRQNKGSIKLGILQLYCTSLEKIAEFRDSVRQVRLPDWLEPGWLSVGNVFELLLE